MWKEISRRIELYYCVLLLDRYPGILPSSFFTGGSILKNSHDFKLYTEIIRGYIFLLKRIHSKDSNFIVALQELRLRKVIRIAAQTKWWSLYLKKNNINLGSIKTLSNLEKIPPLKKANFLSVPREDLLTSSINNSRLVWRRSGGTTGASFSWGHDKALLIINEVSQFFVEMENDGFSFEEQKLKNFYIKFNFPHRTDTSGFRMFLSGEYFLSRDDADFQVKLAAFATAMENAGVLRVSPVELVFLIEELRVANLQPKLDYCLVVGQALDENIRRNAEIYFQCRVIVHYGTQETAPISIECRSHFNQYHLFEEKVIVEVLDMHGRPVPDGTEGHITITSLDNLVMPLVRYQPGDIGVLRRDIACECNHRSPLLEIRNRTTDFIIMKEGEKIPVSEIVHRLYTDPFIHAVRRFQIRQEVVGEIRILLEIRADAERTIRQLQDVLSQGTLSPLKVTLEETRRIIQDSPKFKFFVPMK